MNKMMLVSDYDGTLKSDEKNLMLNIEATKKFRDNGNTFVISTGRNYRSIKRECKKYDISYDYLFCNNGRVLFDENDKIIYKKHLDIEMIKEINSTINNYFGIKSIEYYNSYEQTDLTQDESIIEISLRLNLLNDFSRLKDYLKKKFPDVNFRNYLIYALINNKMNKSKGIEILAKKLSAPKEQIITVGDNLNDLSMLKDYNGYKLASSYPFLYGQGIKTTKEVHTLIRKLEKNI